LSVDAELGFDLLKGLVLATGILLPSTTTTFQGGRTGLVMPIFQILVVEFLQARDRFPFANDKMSSV
jgi:hypothetical protein